MTIQSAQVVITKIWPPKDGKTNYNLVDSAGMKYSTAPEMAEKVREGQAVMLDYEVKEFGGRPFNMTKRLTVTQGGTPMPAHRSAMEDDARRAEEAALRWETSREHPQYRQPAPRPSNGPPVVDKDKMIFVTGIVGRAMGGGKFEPQHIRELTSFACAAWAEFFQ